MKLLFFDIECSNGHDICSFGYVLTDLKFKVLKKEDIVINPESKIVLSASGKRAKIQLAYSQDYFNKQNPFDYFYPKLKALLTNRKHILFGHSIKSDFYYLNYACRRYNLPLLSLQGYDTQKLHQKIYKPKHVESLETIVDQLGIEKDFLYHKSSEDALATMLICKTICEENNINLDTLKSQYSDCAVIS